MAYHETTIAAQATAPGAAGVAVIRISGSAALAVLRGCFSRAKAYEARRMYYGRVILKSDTGGEVVDHALAVYFPAPHSYTGEDCAEIHCHGGQETVRAVLQAAFASGAVPAAPGEFTKRAFLGGRMDLSQAEAVMDIISARAEGARRVALGQLEGRLGQRVSQIQDNLLELLAEIEVTVDYPEEDLEQHTATSCMARLETIKAELTSLLCTARAGRALREGVRCAIIGRPNTGKSSLLNALLGEDRAIVTAQPGTTRDTLDAEASISGLAVTFIDTAGIRHSTDEIERMGVERAKRALSAASLAILVLDGSEGIAEGDRAIYQAVGGAPLIVAVNKADLPQRITAAQAMEDLPCLAAVSISATTQQGVADLEGLIYKACAGDEGLAEGAVLSNLRHIESVREGVDAITEAVNALQEGFPPDTAATDLRRAWHALGQVTGRTTDEDMIDLIFSRFCLGK